MPARRFGGGSSRAPPAPPSALTDSADVIIEAVAKKIDGFPRAFDNIDDLKAKVAVKILQKDLISNTKKRGKNVWDGNVPPQNAPLMMHRKQKEALKDFGFPFDKDETKC